MSDNRSHRNDPFAVLGVNQGASDAELKSAFRKLALKYHPDRHHDASPGAQDAAAASFKEVSEAYKAIRSGAAATQQGAQRTWRTHRPADSQWSGGPFGSADPRDAFWQAYARAHQAREQRTRVRDWENARVRRERAARGAGMPFGMFTRQARWEYPRGNGAGPSHWRDFLDRLYRDLENPRGGFGFPRGPMAHLFQKRVFASGGRGAANLVMLLTAPSLLVFLGSMMMFGVEGGRRDVWPGAARRGSLRDGQLRVRRAGEELADPWDDQRVVTTAEAGSRPVEDEPGSKGESGRTNPWMPSQARKRSD
ncbi:unnamed protein product [Pedinophyceae sp. YPF-701]|nr:unnamed protein product [Pedinophyceae sp. YPF-701]